MQPGCGKNARWRRYVDFHDLCRESIELCILCGQRGEPRHELDHGQPDPWYAGRKREPSRADPRTQIDDCLARTGRNGSREQDCVVTNTMAAPGLA
jgi:hypothetical protein